MRVGLWCVIIGTAVGCGGYGSAFKAERSIAEARCQRAVACQDRFPSESETSWEARYGADEDDCVARIGPDQTREDAWDRAEERGDFAYSLEAAKTCVSEVGETTCEAFFGDVLPAACDSAVQGTFALDEDCSLDAQCASGLCSERRCTGPVPDDAEGEDS